MSVTVIDKDRITDENVQDVIDTAAYGGITYWAGEPQWDAIKVPEGTVATIRDTEVGDEAGGSYYFLTADRIREAIVEVAEGKHTNDRIRDYVRSAFEGWTEEDGLDMVDIDADAADCIVQVACFGEVVYG